MFTGTDSLCSTRRLPLNVILKRIGGGGLVNGRILRLPLIDTDGVVRYVGKGTGRRVDSHLGVILALAASAPATRASEVHRRFAADI